MAGEKYGPAALLNNNVMSMDGDLQNKTESERFTLTTENCLSKKGREGRLTMKNACLGSVCLCSKERTKCLQKFVLIL